jgi:hypothetical protein
MCYVYKIFTLSSYDNINRRHLKIYTGEISVWKLDFISMPNYKSYFSTAVFSSEAEQQKDE